MNVEQLTASIAQRDPLLANAVSTVPHKGTDGGGQYLWRMERDSNGLKR